MPFLQYLSISEAVRALNYQPNFEAWLAQRFLKMTTPLEQAPELPQVGFERSCMQFGVPNDSEIGLSWVCRANVKTVLSLQRELK